MEQSIYLVTLVGTALVLAAAFSSLIAFRFGAPLLLLFLGLGLAAGTDGLGIEFDNARLAYFVGCPGSCRHPVRVRLRHAGHRAPPGRHAAAFARDHRRRHHHRPVRRGRLLSDRFQLAGIVPAWRRRGLHRRGGGVLPVARRQCAPARPRALDPRNRVRHQRSDRHLPDHHAGRGDRRRLRSRGRGAGRRPRRRLLRPHGARRDRRRARRAGDRAAGRPGSISITACCRSSC